MADHNPDNNAEVLQQVRDLLVAQGETALTSQQAITGFSEDGEWWELLNDLEHYPHAFVMGCLVDRQVKADVAWKVPFLLRERLGTFEIDDLAALGPEDWVRLLREPTPAHRMPETMAEVLHQGVHRILDSYAGNATNMWNDTPSSARLVRRFLAFHGAGPKIATMAANILVRDFRIPVRDYRYIDISSDVHVRRVMVRVGFLGSNSAESNDEVIYAARELNPDFPGIFDVALWKIGRDHCRPNKPDCHACPLDFGCVYARDHRG